MKTQLLFFSLISILVFSSECKKSKNTNTTDPVTTTPSNEVFKCNFDDASNLGLWTKTSGGTVMLENNSAKLTSVSTCFGIETADLIPVKKGQSYSLKFKLKINTIQSGPANGCVGYFMISVSQGNDTPLFKTANEAVDWTNMAYSFEAVTSAQIKISFATGLTDGAYIDDVVLIEN